MMRSQLAISKHFTFKPAIHVRVKNYQNQGDSTYRAGHKMDIKSIKFKECSEKVKAGESSILYLSLKCALG